MVTHPVIIRHRDSFLLRHMSDINGLRVPPSNNIEVIFNLIKYLHKEASALVSSRSYLPPPIGHSGSSYGRAYVEIVH